MHTNAVETNPHLGARAWNPHAGIVAQLDARQAAEDRALAERAFHDSRLAGWLVVLGLARRSEIGFEPDADEPAALNPYTAADAILTARPLSDRELRAEADRRRATRAARTAAPPAPEPLAARIRTAAGLLLSAAGAPLAGAPARGMPPESPPLASYRRRDP